MNEGMKIDLSQKQEEALNFYCDHCGKRELNSMVGAAATFFTGASAVGFAVFGVGKPIVEAFRNYSGEITSALANVPVASTAASAVLAAVAVWSTYKLAKAVVEDNREHSKIMSKVLPFVDPQKLRERCQPCVEARGRLPVAP